MDNENLMEDIRKGLGSIHMQLSQLESQIALLERRMAELKAENESLVALKNAVAMAMGKPGDAVDVKPTVEARPQAQVKTEYKPVVAEKPKAVEKPAEKVEAPVMENPKAEEREKQPEPVQIRNVASTRPVDGRLIQDLHKAIGLNDRLRFRHDLFGNDNDLMSKTIDALDEMADEASAMKYVSDHFDWNSEDETVKYFMDIIHRRFFV